MPGKAELWPMLRTRDLGGGGVNTSGKITRARCVYKWKRHGPDVSSVSYICNEGRHFARGQICFGHLEAGGESWGNGGKLMLVL